MGERRMKRSEMIEHINEFLEEGIGMPDYSGKKLLATQFLSFIESKGMQPPPYFKTVLTGPPAKEGVSNLVLLSRVEKCEGWEDEE